MKAEIARERCIGAGTCVTVAPEMFDQNEDDGIAVVLQDNVPSDSVDRVETAAELCPVSAILLSRNGAAAA